MTVSTIDCRNITTMDHLPGVTSIEVLGVVRGSSIRARHVGSDIVAALRNIVGGEVPEYVKLMAGAREQAMDRMIAEAEALGANAIISMRYGTSMVMHGAAEVLAYGTAVRITSS